VTALTVQPPGREPDFHRGLVVAVAQDAKSGKVLMVAHMDREAYAATLATGLATFFSRSRGRLWVKGETSGNRLDVVEVRIDCDGDAILLQVAPRGPACHTGAGSCFEPAPEGAAAS
jgi:phosphoribosyl-AMP cyclohydrolase